MTDDPAPAVKATTETSPKMLKPLWQTKLNVQETDFIEFLSNDRVLVGTIDTNEMGGGLKPDEIMLLNSANGETVWTSPRDSYGSDQTLLAVDPVILLQGSKKVAALDPEKGNTLWSLEKPGEKSCMLSARNLIVFLSRSKGQPTSLQAVNVKTGSEVWRTPLENYPEKKDVKIEVTAMADTVLLSGPQAAAFSASDGKLLWQMAFPGNFGSKAVVIPLGEELYFSDSASITRADPKSGKQLWSEAISDGTFEALTASEHHLFVIIKGSGENPPDWIAALDSDTGKQLWKSDLLERAASPVSIEGNLLYVTTPRNVIGMDALNGSAVFRSAVPTDLQSERLLPDNLRIEGDRIIVARETGVLGVQKADGKLVFADHVRGGTGFTYDYATNKIRHAVMSQTPRSKKKKKRQEEPPRNPDSVAPDENYRVAMAQQKAAYESMAAYIHAGMMNSTNMITNATQPIINQHREDVLPGQHVYSIRDQQRAANLALVSTAAVAGVGIAASIINAKILGRRMESYQARVTQAIETHANSLQEKFYLRPAYEQHRGWSLHVVNLETGQRGNILLSSDEDLAPDTLAANLPAFSTNGSQIVSKGLGSNPETAKRAWHRKTWAGKVALASPSVLAFDLASVPFEPCSKSPTIATETADPAKRALDDQLIEAAFMSDIGTVRKSLDAGADVNALDAYGKTALMLAAESVAMYNKTDIIKLLLDRGADPFVRDPSGLTALEHLLLLNPPPTKGIAGGLKLLKKAQKEAE
jgi:outer membrane protein assembly factor BamB